MNVEGTKQMLKCKRFSSYHYDTFIGVERAINKYLKALPKGTKIISTNTDYDTEDGGGSIITIFTETALCYPNLS